jgi:hypothetical protein
MEREGTLLPPGTSGATGNSLRGTTSSSGTTATTSNTPNTYPTCSRCRNHWLKIRVKGHKRFCVYRDCTCEKCTLVAEGQKISALRMAVWRAQAQDETHVAKQVSQYQKESVIVTHKVPSVLDSALNARIGNLLHYLQSPTGGRTQTTAPVATGTDSRSLGETSDSLYSSDSSPVTQATAQVASAAPATISLTIEGSSYPVSTGGRTLPAAPVTDFLSVEGCCKALCSPLSSTCGRTLPITPLASTSTWMYSSPTDRSSYTLPTGGRVLTTAPFASAAPWMDSSPIEWSCHTVSTSGTSLPTVPSAESNPLQFSPWCGLEHPYRGSTTDVCYETLLNQYYLNLRCIMKPY